MNSFYNDVNDWLSTGGDLDLARDLTGLEPAATVKVLRDHGVTHVLDVRSEWEDRALWVAGGLAPENYVHAPITDNQNHRPAESWYQAVEGFVERFWLDSSEGDRLYVHCHMGINRGTSAAMLAMLTVNPLMHPFDAFQQIREVRSAAGLIYAEHVGARHIINSSGRFDQCEFVKTMETYWTPERIREVNRGIAYYRDAEGGTIKVGGKSALACPTNAAHRVKWNSGDPRCMDCDASAVSVSA